MVYTQAEVSLPPGGNSHQYRSSYRDYCMSDTRKTLTGKCAVLVLLALALWSGIGQAAETASSGGKALLAKYPTISAKLQKNQFAAPIYLESTEVEGSLKVDMYGVVPHSFNTVKDALQSPVNWCDITSMHINIKACTARKTADQGLVTIYSGRKYYQPPADAYQLKLKFRIAAQQPDYLDIALAANEGPLRTKDHRIRLEAVHGLGAIELGVHQAAAALLRVHH